MHELYHRVIKSSGAESSAIVPFEDVDIASCDATCGATTDIEPVDGPGDVVLWLCPECRARYWGLQE